MANLDPSKQRRGLVAIDGAMALIVVQWEIQATSFAANKTSWATPSISESVVR
jgi:hypothetical protein